MGNLAFAAPDALQLPPMNLQELGISHIAPSVLVLAEQRPEYFHPIESHARENARIPCPFGGKVADGNGLWISMANGGRKAMD